MKTVAIVAILTAATLTWAQSYSTSAGRQPPKSQSTKPAKKLSPEQKMWCPVLEYALTTAKSFDPPMRAYLLDTAGFGIAKCDAEKVRIALADSFTATLAIPETDEDSQRLVPGYQPTLDQAWVESRARQDSKRQIQDSVLTHLLSVDEPAAESLLDKAEPSIKPYIMGTIISRSVTAKNYNHALEVLKRVPTGGFPYREATELMLTLPPSRDTDKQEIFRLAMAANREQHWLQIGDDDFA